MSTQQNPIDILFSKGNINAVYETIQKYIKSKYNIDIGRDYLSELVEIMKMVVKPIKRIPKDVDTKKFINTINQQTLREAIPIFENTVQNSPSSQQQSQQSQQDRMPNMQGMNLPGGIPQPSLGGSDDNGQRQIQELDELYSQIANERNNASQQPQQQIDFTQGLPQLNDPKYNTNVDELFNNANSYRQNGSDVSIPPPNITNLKQLPFQTTENFKLSKPPIYQNSQHSQQQHSQQQQHSMSTPISALRHQNNIPSDNREHFQTPQYQQQQQQNIPLSVDSIYGDLNSPQSSQSSQSSQSAFNYSYNSEYNKSQQQIPIQTDFTKNVQGMNSYNPIAPQPRDMSLLIPKVSRNTKAASKSNIIPVIVSVDSRNKDPTQDHNSYTIELDEIRDVLSLELTDAQIPISEYVINETNNIIYFEETDGITLLAEMVVGNYDATTLAAEIETQMNAATGAASTYTVAVDPLQKKFIISSDGGGGGGVFNLLFDGGTETIGFEKEKTIYIQRSIGEVIGFPPEDLSGDLMYTSDFIYNLNGEKYILLYIKEAELIKTRDSNVKNAFAKIVLDKSLGDTKYYNRNIDNKFIKYFSPPIGRLSKLTIEFRKQNGELYDFNGQSNSLSFEIVTKDITTHPYYDDSE